MENSRNLFSTGKNQNTKQNIDNRRLNLTTFGRGFHTTVAQAAGRGMKGRKGAGEECLNYDLQDLRMTGLVTYMVYPFEA